RELPAGFRPRLPGVAGIAIAIEDRLDDLVRLLPLAQERERLRPVAHVDDRLRRGDADARFGPEHAVADGEDARLDGSAELARVGIVAEDGERADVVGTRLLPFESRGEKGENDGGA